MTRNLSPLNMGEGAFTVPILPGKRAALEDLCETLQGSKSKDVSEMLKRHGSDKETWFIESGSQGDVCIVYWEAEPPAKPIDAFVRSRHPFDVWLKSRLNEICGVDLNNPPPMELPKQVFRSGF